jgi:PPK2 family polyphosphate:nucleotide phosphotransferase
MRVDGFRVRPGDRRALRRHRPDERGPFAGKSEALDHLKRGVEELEARQELLHAQGEHSLLIILQGLDAAGKDSAIKHVMSGVNPQGTEVHAFKQPSQEELAHDYLWRAATRLPERGRIGIFNRSYYEEVLVVRVHPELLGAERLPDRCVTKKIWAERFEDINAFERYLWRNGTIVRKFFLYVSRAEQRQRLLERLVDPSRNWKFSPADLAEHGRWRDYMDAYRDALAATSTAHAPWYIVPADHKWFAHALIADVIVRTLDDLDLRLPKLPRDQRRALREARRKLEAEEKQ